ncbi:MAG: diaminopimelate epimerase [Syntrophotalea acetylenica]|jgi:diaminopimelate epimerase|uniref:Diaminopimelate epimerase n=1 Tax=Syntrophotalea acetylenica TaxID=29542 RepID=A0A1L3GFB1_SYNAC|nr:diaminopimelate epimerase [Syntrophotalea acetylenica]APG24662.1 diaminopimelate epimerase [Syntrophotalea acetylenica]APG42710.1 diaminopimelate epimerase [Syntrophotalea acetylenica]MDD4456461.1 diaminopimelate epimerase [Syntrophotalea acetylenica]MDY0262178.1 diaminopimelate epimerase [Syntrophotalea acetylenica]
MKFAKMHGAGNDYVYVNCFEEIIDDPVAMARTVSNRNFGIGSDGLILILPSGKADVRMRMFNSDGSESEMCGNGIRCVAKYAYDHGIVDKKEITAETGAGILTLQLFTNPDNRVERVRVNMGKPRLSRGEIPMTGNPREQVINQELKILDRTFHITCVSMGNPHCIIFVDNVDEFPVAKYGPVIENLDLFPNRTNVEFIEIISPTEIKQRTWERGAGETLACGTGSSAVTVACVLNGRTEHRVLNHLLGGDLEMEWAQDGSVYMTGPAVQVFEGDFDPR